jgi:tetratricopeptide (TPR) repeat protein
VRDAAEGVEKVSRTIFSDSTVSLSAFGPIVAKSFAQNVHTYSAPQLDSVIEISEDAIACEDFCYFFEGFKGLQISLFPIIIIYPTGSSESLISGKLNRLPSEFFTREISARGQLKEHFSLQRVEVELNRSIPDLYRDMASTALALTRGPLPTSSSSNNDTLWIEYTRLRGGGVEKGKFSTLKDANSLRSKLLDATSSPSRRMDSVVQYTLAFVNLWLLYCTERDPGLLKQAHGISESLKDSMLEAHVLRLSSMFKKDATNYRAQLDRAASIFTENESPDYAMFCLNNKLVANFYTNDNTVDDYHLIIEGILPLIPTIRGAEIIYNNAGIAHLIDNRLESAIDLFQKGLALNSQIPVVRLGLLINKAIAHFLSGDDVGNDVRVALNFASRRVDQNYEYQLANAIFNSIAMVDRGSDVWSELIEKAKALNLFQKVETFDDTTSLFDPLSKAGLYGGRLQQHPGKRGTFISRFGLIPMIYHTWL